mmetsp:Transcript_16286/g.35358  ORF Transcript_16286/g.35358 Transcript_16286/m.35358 type:complete len:284 (-) Transcript_16286:188-1039(-)
MVLPRIPPWMMVLLLTSVYTSVLMLVAVSMLYRMVLRMPGTLLLLLLLLLIPPTIHQKVFGSDSVHKVVRVAVRTMLVAGVSSVGDRSRSRLTVFAFLRWVRSCWLEISRVRCCCCCCCCRGCRCFGPMRLVVRGGLVLVFFFVVLVVVTVVVVTVHSFTSRCFVAIGVPATVARGKMQLPDVFRNEFQGRRTVSKAMLPTVTILPVFLFAILLLFLLLLITSVIQRGHPQQSNGVGTRWFEFSFLWGCCCCIRCDIHCSRWHTQFGWNETAVVGIAGWCRGL